jgi:hypothetical protein
VEERMAESNEINPGRSHGEDAILNILHNFPFNKGYFNLYKNSVGDVCSKTNVQK